MTRSGLSRVIKFRAWFEEEQEMRNVAMNNIYKGKSEYLYLNPMPGSNYETIKLMQFTGLHDKNGVEVYEGDIVRKTLNGKENFIGQVIYSEGTYFLELPPEEYVFLFDEHQIYENEVIGNIYQHPHLLEGS